MKKQDKILMPVDFSECTLNTLLYAKSIAEATQAELELLYVKSKDSETKTTRQKDYKERLAEIVDKDERLKNFPVTLNVCEGERIKEIIKFHKRHKCNLIVIRPKVRTILVGNFLAPIHSISFKKSTVLSWQFHAITHINQ